MTIDKIRRSFGLFIKNLHPDWDIFDYQLKIANKLQAEYEAPGNTRLMFSMPPGLSKSMLGTQLWSAYLLGRNPKLKIIICSYSHTVANNQGQLARRYMETPVYKHLFPDTVITSDGESGTFKTSAGGGILSVGRGGSITSFRADVIIVDDILKDSNEATSNAVLDKLGPWFWSTLYTRFSKGSTTCLFVIGTCWSQRDLFQVITDKFPNWEHIKINAICDDEATDFLNRKLGQSIEDKMLPISDIEAIREASPATFNALYMNNPISDSSCWFTKVNLLAATELPLVDKTAKPVTVVSLDTATETNSQSDYTVAIEWLVYQDYVVVNQISKMKVDFNELVDYTKAIKADYVVVEKASSGQQLLQVLPDLIPSKVFKDKQSWVATIDYELGKTIFIVNSELTVDIREEILSYPFGRHDDTVLSLLHGYRYITENKAKLKHKVKSKPNIGYWLTKNKQLTGKH